MGPYEMKLICSWCGKCYGTKPNIRPNEESHGFCGKECVTGYCKSVGIDPANIIKNMERRKHAG